MLTFNMTNIINNVTFSKKMSLFSCVLTPVKKKATQDFTLEWPSYLFFLKKN